MAGKKLKAAKAQVDRERLYQPLDAVRLLKSFETAKFDEAVEAHFRLGLNVRHADQQLRGSLMLPHGTGRTKTVAVFAQGEHARAAEEAGADYVGADDLATRVQEGWTDFDVALATPDMMAVVGRLGRVLGPQGKMPNPRSGTITFEIAKAVEEIKAGKIEYRTENRAGLVHVVIGRKSFEVERAGRELRGRAGGDPARQARLGQGPLHPLDRTGDDDGPRHQGRPGPHPRPARGARDGARVRLKQLACMRTTVQSPTP